METLKVSKCVMKRERFMRYWNLKYHKHGLITRAVCYYGVGSQVFMSFFFGLLGFDLAIFQIEGVVIIVFDL
jgi:hypothetical protein